MASLTRTHSLTSLLDFPQFFCANICGNICIATNIVISVIFAVAKMSANFSVIFLQKYFLRIFAV